MKPALSIHPCTELVLKYQLGTITLMIRQAPGLSLTYAVQTVPQHHEQALTLLELAGGLLEKLPTSGLLSDAVAKAKACL